METWDIASLDVQPHHPEVLRSDAETRVIAINLPAGELLQEHETHERAYVVVVDGEVEIDQGGQSVSGAPASWRTSRPRSGARSGPGRTAASR